MKIGDVRSTAVIGTGLMGYQGGYEVVGILCIELWLGKGSKL